MKQCQNQNNSDMTTCPIFRKNRHFRIRSTSRQNFLATLSNTKKNSVHTREEEKQQYVDRKPIIKIKIKGRILQSQRLFSQKKLKSNKSEQKQSPKKDVTQLSLPRKKFDEVTNLQFKEKIVYESIRTEEAPVSKKRIFEINTIDTQEDLKIIDRISNLCDPNRIISQFSKQKQHKNSLKSLQCNNRQKNEKNSKSFKLGTKINNMMHDQGLKAKLKSNFKHKNKFDNKNNSEESQPKINNNQTNQLQKFWQDINQSLILASKQQEERYVSKDLKQFVFKNMLKID